MQNSELLNAFNVSLFHEVQVSEKQVVASGLASVTVLSHLTGRDHTGSGSQKTLEGQDRGTSKSDAVKRVVFKYPCKRCKTSRNWSCLSLPRQETLPPPPPPVVPSALGPEVRKEVMARMTRTLNHRFFKSFI